ncbi:hypothetical protein, partial [Arthrobacter yangruifuii]|uniref:hypothetical protein n=1 Tax=Arthrobacter yangruifuii TaxID=2606616 RepID=UPI001FE97171
MQNLDDETSKPKTTGKVRKAQKNRRRSGTALATGITVVVWWSVATGGPAVAAPGDSVVAYELQEVEPDYAKHMAGGLYIYRKLDPDRPAAWSNSGTQTLLASQPGYGWFSGVYGLLPPGLCGPGWGLTEYIIQYPDPYAWPPETITYPNWPEGIEVLDTYDHSVDDYWEIPDCEPTDPPVDVPTDPTDPATPVDPTDPATPVDPTDPATPVDPTDPATPVDPTDPATPVDPTDPATPVDPTDP